MLLDFIVQPEAEEDIFDAYEWYENQELGLGEEYLTCVDACLFSITQNPNMFPIVFENYHRALIRRFPYSIFYENNANLIVIYSVFHCSQDPKKWKKRLNQ